MKTFYVSLVRDLIGLYIAFEAEDEATVRMHLANEYLDPKTGIWKLPWCAIYEKIPTKADVEMTGKLPQVYRARRQPLVRELVEEDYYDLHGFAERTAVKA